MLELRSAPVVCGAMRRTLVSLVLMSLAACDDSAPPAADAGAPDAAPIFWPHCQVGLLRPCIEAQAVDECGPAPAACTAFYQCAGG